MFGSAWRRWVPRVVRGIIGSILATLVIAAQATPVRAAAMHALFGVIRDVNGDPVKGVQFQLANSNGQPVSSPHFPFRTQADGVFNTQVPEGDYRLQLFGNRQQYATNGVTPETFYLDVAINFTGDIMQDLVVDTTTITITTKDQYGRIPAPGVFWHAEGHGVAPNLFPGAQIVAAESVSDKSTSNNPTTSTGTLVVLRGLNYTATAGSGTFFGYTPGTQTIATPVTTPQDLNITTTLNALSGRVRDKFGEPVKNARIDISRVDGTTEGSAFGAGTPADGSFIISAAPGTYYITVSGSPQFPPTGHVPTAFQIRFKYTLTQPSVQDLTIDTVDIAVNVVDRNGDQISPIGAVTPMIDEPRAAPSSDLHLYPGAEIIDASFNTRKSNGTGSFPAFVGLTGTLYGDSGVGYVQKQQPLSTPFTGDSAVTLVMDPNIPAPTLATPAALTAEPPVLSWNGVANAYMYQIYRDGVPINAESPFTHSAAAEGVHQYVVVGINTYGVRSYKSNTVTVTYDKTKPVVTGLSIPTVNSAQTANITATITDNVGLGGAEYFVGNDPGVGNGTAMTLNGNTATATVAPQAVGVYTVNVRSRDAVGNWSDIRTATLTVQPPPDSSPAATFGMNYEGQLGDGTTNSGRVPRLPIDLGTAVDVAAGANFGMALKPDGTVWTWGGNGDGQLGRGNTTPSLVPVKVPGLDHVVAVSAGNQHAVALKDDGTVWAWGSNYGGALGTGCSGNSCTSPVQVAGLTGVSAIDAGGFHTLALKPDGSVWAWGWNGSGQIGNGNTTNTPTPAQVQTSIRRIAAGYQFSLTISNTGEISSWGTNSTGELGNGGFIFSSRPTAVAIPPGAVEIAAGFAHALALMPDGTVMGWGDNGRGELGVDSGAQPVCAGTGQRCERIPVQVPGTPLGISKIAAGTYDSLAVDLQGHLWGWGWAQLGQLARDVDNLCSCDRVPAPAQGVYAVTTVSASGFTLVLGQIDTLAPTITATPSRTANAAGWYDGPVTFTFACTDNGSQVSSCAAQQTLSIDGGNQSVTGTVTDNAGNVTSVTVAGINIDGTAPTVQIPIVDPNPATAGQPASLTASTTDNLSGVVGGEYYLGTTDPGVGQGSAMTLENQTLSAPLGDLPPGSYTLSVRAKDYAGHWSATRSITYAVAAVPPANLAAVSPTATAPRLSWDSLSGAVSYKVYRNDQFIGTSSQSTLTDSGLTSDGTFSYQVSAVYAGGYEGPRSGAISVVHDTTGPTVTALNWSANPVTQGHDTTLTATADDPVPASGVVAGEYFIGNDPGPGNGTPMTLTDGTLTATLTASQPVGSHPVGVRARDAAHNWGPVRTGEVTVRSALAFRTVGSGSRSSSGNNSLVSTLTNSAAPGDTVVMSVATGTFAGAVGCTDAKGNSYTITADKNTGNGRLFICSAAVATALTPGDTVTATYPGFSGLSVASVNAISGLNNPGTVVASQTSSGSNPSVSSGPITPPTAPAVIVGAVVNNGTATFTSSSQYTMFGQVSAGTGSGRKTVTPVYAVAANVAQFDLTGSLSGSGFWQSAITAYAATAGSI